jgi:hypothetical protein
VTSVLYKRNRTWHIKSEWDEREENKLDVYMPELTAHLGLQMGLRLGLRLGLRFCSRVCDNDEKESDMPKVNKVNETGTL